MFGITSVQVSRHNINIGELTHAHPLKYDDYHYILQNTWNYRFPLIIIAVLITWWFVPMALLTRLWPVRPDEAGLMSNKFPIIASLCLPGIMRCREKGASGEERWKTVVAWWRMRRRILHNNCIPSSLAESPARGTMTHGCSPMMLRRRRRRRHVGILLLSHNMCL